MYCLTRHFNNGTLTLTPNTIGGFSTVSKHGLDSVLPDMEVGTVYSLKMDITAVITYGARDQDDREFGGHVLHNYALPTVPMFPLSLLPSGLRLIAECPDNLLGETTLKLSGIELGALWTRSLHTDETGSYVSYADTIVRLLNLPLYDWVTLQYQNGLSIFIHSEPMA
jgi:hypothetical protein